MNICQNELFSHWVSPYPKLFYILLFAKFLIDSFMQYCKKQRYIIICTYIIIWISTRLVERTNEKKNLYLNHRVEPLPVSNSSIPKVSSPYIPLSMYAVNGTEYTPPPSHSPAKSNSPQLIGKVTFKKLSERWGQHPIRSGGMIKFSIIASRLRRGQILTAGRGLSLYLYDPTTTPPLHQHPLTLVNP